MGGGVQESEIGLALAYPLQDILSHIAITFLIRMAGVREDSPVAEKQS